MTRLKRRTFSLLVGSALLVGACGGRAEEAAGTGALDQSGGTGGAVGSGATGGAITATNGDGGTGGVPASGGGNVATGTGGAGGGTGVAMATGGAPVGGTGAATASGGAAGSGVAFMLGGMSAGGAVRVPGSSPPGELAAGAASTADCNALSEEGNAAYEEAIQCDPGAAVDECTVAVQLPYGCDAPLYFNPAHADAIARFTQAVQATAAGRCPTGPGGGCAPVIRGHCSGGGTCVGVPQGNGRNCEVNGFVYASGEANIYNPWNCSTCSCNDGLLDCAANPAACDAPACPDGQVVAVGCAQCAGYGVVTSTGPVTLCQTVEYGCFTPCSTSCADPNATCEDNLCVPSTCSVMDPNP